MKIIKKLWSLSPILALTDDKNYGYNNANKSDSCRFSIINFRCGRITHYLCSWNIHDNQICFELHHKLDLYECQWENDRIPGASECNDGNPNQDMNKQKMSEFEKLSSDQMKHIDSISSENIDMEKEFITYLINNEKARNQIAMEKMAFYTAIILVILPLFCGITYNMINTYLNTSPSWFFAIFVGLIILLGLALTNLTLLTLQFMSVSSVASSTFSSLKKPQHGRTRKKQLIYNYYYDWRSRHDFAQMQIAAVKETELFLKTVLLLAFITFLFASLFNLLPHAESQALTLDTGISYTVCIDNLNSPFSEDSVLLAKLHAEIKQFPPQYIIVLLPSNDSSNIHTHFCEYVDYIPIYYLVDKTLENNEFKIGFGG